MSEKSAMNLVFVIFGLLLIVPSMLFNGWVLQTLWLWFLVPAFRFPAITIWTAIGIRVIAGLLTSYSWPSDEDKEIGERIVRAIAMAFVYPSIVLGIAWMVRP